MIDRYCWTDCHFLQNARKIKCEPMDAKGFFIYSFFSFSFFCSFCFGFWISQRFSLFSSFSMFNVSVLCLSILSLSVLLSHPSIELCVSNLGLLGLSSPSQFRNSIIHSSYLPSYLLSIAITINQSINQSINQNGRKKQE